MSDTGAPTEITGIAGITGITAFAENHLPAIADFWVASWAKTMPTIDFEARRPWIRAHLARLASEGVAIRVALAGDGQPVGFVTVEPASGHIDQVCVSPTHWGAGIADDLIAEAKRIAPAGLTLDVNADNPRAIAFYQRNGFHETGRGVNPASGLPILSMTWAKA